MKNYLRIASLTVGAVVVALLWFVRVDILNWSACHMPLLSRVMLPTVADYEKVDAIRSALFCVSSEGIDAVVSGLSVQTKGYVRALDATATYCNRLPADLGARTIRQLLAKTADVDPLLNGDEPPLAYASTADCARVFMSAGAKLEYQLLGQPQSVLSKAPIVADRLPVYEELLKSGANPNFRGEDGATIIMHASDPAYIKLLVRYGADPNLKDNDGLNALDHAYKEKDQQKADALIAAGAKVGTFVSADQAQADYAYKNQHAILGGGSVPDECRVSVRTHSPMFADGGDTWTMSVGTELDITVRCLDGGVLHAAVVPNQGDVEVFPNLFMMNGVGSFKFKARKPYDDARLRFFRSQGSVDNLAAAVADGKARAVAQKSITAAVPQ